MTAYNNLSKLIHIGNFPELDTDEGSYGYEGSTAPIIGTVISGPSANSRIVDFDYDDADGDGLFEANHRTASAENVTIDGVSSEVDETVLVTVRLTYADGSTSTESILGYQLENGEFLSWRPLWSH
ncbi:hypothetical protein K3555_22450 (plasmid) [Leisingera sp. M527]|uniref:hypothetical protein n=1 Tax=Leisingera sp. M527 TaxID=2867014 RepID=UPI0021A8829E|nr:hypothetical protein [Leisingera sp. M527]UWQ35427.1 hypothetical protein K3555_22450 [Leisingera sp. M527]